MRLLLLSNSTLYGRGYLDHAAEEIGHFFRGLTEILFFPYALHDRDAYAAKARERFARMGLRLSSIHEAPDPKAAARHAAGFFIGGGNTFRLLQQLYAYDLLGPIREKGLAGSPYLGASAGSNVACPTIETTNDMPIVQPPSFEGLGLVPFNINPHYLDPDPGSTHMGETRETRIREFHEMNDPPVLALREGAWLRVEGKEASLGGTAGAKLFEKGKPPREIRTGEPLAFLLRSAAC